VKNCTGQQGQSRFVVIPRSPQATYLQWNVSTARRPTLLCGVEEKRDNVYVMPVPCSMLNYLTWSPEYLLLRLTVFLPFSYKLHKNHRPAAMKSTVVKKRNRYSKKRVGSDLSVDLELNADQEKG
jgi:hypothetical protein